MRLGIRTAISALVLTSIAVSAVGVHLLWWRTAHQVSQTLANTINDQIVSAVGDELQSVTTEARSSMMAVRTLLAEKVFEPRDAGKREVVFRSQLLSQPTISWVAFGWPDGSFFAGHKAGDGVIEMLEITPDRKLRTNRYEFVGNELQFKNSHVEDTKYSVTDQEWFRTAIETNDEHWATFTTHPKGERLAAAFAAPIDIDKKPAGVIAIIIELTRVSNFLSQLTVGKSAGAFILERNGKVVAAPDPNANEAVALKTDHPLFPIAVEAIQNASAYEPGEGQPFNTKVTRDGKAYQAVLTPISFPGWSLVTVVPESEFLGPVQMTIRNLLIGLAVLIVFAGLLSAWLAQRLIAAPLIKVVNEIRHVERFDLDKVQRHPSRLTEIENLSGAIGDMAQGLAAFRKYIPADLVEAADQRRQRRAPRRRDTADERDVHRSRRLYRHVGAARRPHHSAAVALFRQRLGANSKPERHHRQIHRRCRDGVLGRAGAQPRSCRRLLPGGPGMPARDGGGGPRRRPRRAASRFASASIPATCWSAISDRKCG